MEHDIPKMVSHVLQEGLIHTLSMVPVLFVVFLVMEFISHRSKGSWIAQATRHPVAGPIGAALLGLLPQCGFSVAATTMFLEGLIPMGSLIAAYIATSDEAVPILLSDPTMLGWIGPLLITKLVWGSVAGIAINAGLGRHAIRSRGRVADQSLTHSGTCFAQSAGWRVFVPHALSRTARISAMVYVLSSLFNLGGHLMEGSFAGLFSGTGISQPLIASVLGLIPSCATSVALTEGFRAGLISFPAVIGGLTSNAGVGLLVLIKESRNKMQVVSVILLLLVSAFIAGLLATLLV